MTPAPPTRFVVLTPPGRGAVASLSLEGPQAAALVDELALAVGVRPSQRPAGQITLARWVRAVDGEEVIVSRRGAERFEIHCHGGLAAVAEIGAELARRGCRQIDWRQWLIESDADSIAAAAAVALTQAPTVRTAGILWDQHGGALGADLAALRQEIVRHEIAAARRRTSDLLEFAGLGRHLIRAWRVVVAGPPNVGKSSLINALAGFERAIVHDRPGTTRDVLATSVAFDGWPMELFDTAGLRDSGDEIELAGMRLAEEQLQTADLVVLVCDATDRWASGAARLAHIPADALLVVNKCDLARRGDEAQWPAGAVATSATQRQGLDLLVARIVARLVPRAPQPGQAVPFSTGQVELLRGVEQALTAGSAEDALQLLAAGPALEPAEC